MQNNSELIKSVESRFINQFNRRPEIVSLAPARINIIGEHTDYNDGLAMPAAINRYICSAISRSTDNNISILSMNYDKAIKIPLDAEFEGMAKPIPIDPDDPGAIIAVLIPITFPSRLNKGPPEFP